MRGENLAFYVFTGRAACPTPFGDHIFLCLKKDMEERQIKGLRPLESPGVNGDLRGDVLASYEFARMQLTRLGPSVACGKHTVSTDSVVLHRVRRKRWHSKNIQRDSTFEAGWLRKSPCFPPHRSTQRQGDKRSAAADLIASETLSRSGSHKARPVGVPINPRG